MEKADSVGLRDEALRKIGRNLVNFQRFERALKLIIVRSDVKGYASELAAAYRRKVKDTERKPLGWLVKDFLATMYSNEATTKDEPIDPTEVWMSFKLTIEVDKESIRTLRRELSDVVKQRNFLTHKVLANFDPASAESCRNLISLLDDQNAKLEPHYLAVMRVMGDMYAAQQAAFAELEAQMRVIEADGGNAA